VQPANDELSPTGLTASDASPRSIQTKSLMGTLLFQQHQQRLAAKESITPNGSNGLKRRRVVKRDPNKPSPKAWSQEEVAEFKKLIADEGPGSWEQKSVKLGGVRSAKALHTRWLREQGRIVDRPRGAASPATTEQVRTPAYHAVASLAGRPTNRAMPCHDRRDEARLPQHEPAARRPRRSGVRARRRSRPPAVKTQRLERIQAPAAPATRPATRANRSAGAALSTEIRTAPHPRRGRLKRSMSSKV
jgi:hypothetical protein